MRKGKPPVLRPDTVLYIRQEVRGMALCGGRIALSVSFGSKDSKLAFYRSPLDEEGFEVRLSDRHSTRGHLIDDRLHQTTVKTPAGSQDLEFRDGRLLVVFEGATKPYRRRWRKEGALPEDRVFAVALPKEGV